MTEFIYDFLGSSQRYIAFIYPAVCVVYIFTAALCFIKNLDVYLRKKIESLPHSSTKYDWKIDLASCRCQT